ncbi:sulfatase [Salinisphaera aquimarina]|uniref:Sulfatase n=1 Tax=Salinisphaera aquimarina TaxID=2094031 RepID=A0ABV7EQB3_9GAMM
MRLATRRRMTSGAAALARGLLALVLLYGLAVLPHTPGGFAQPSWWPLPAETAVIALLALLLPRAGFNLLRVVVTLAAALVLALKLADLGTFAAFNRGFNPLLDAQLPRFGWNVLSHSIGTGLALIASAGAVLLLAITLALLFWTLGGLRDWPRTARRILAGMSLLGLATWLLPALMWPQRAPLLADAATTRLVGARGVQIVASARDLARFRQTLAADSQSPAPEPLFKTLADKDVLLVFVESYGRSAIDRPLYGDVIKPRLATFQHEIGAAGFHARSGWLTSPTFGGQSWLAHATLLSGLWIDNQPRYAALIDSDRFSLNRLFAHAGWHTAAVMPAITRAWPEGDWYGYDATLGAADLGYRGRPFNWITMPDQYTLAAIQRDLLTPGDRPPVMIETALISSHAPWTPIPPLLDWHTIGDGRVFNKYADAGDPPEVVWQDYDRVRAQYRKAIDYSLQTLASFIATRANDDLVVIILGDHQPAPLVTGDNASRDVPIHIIAHDPAVLEAIGGWHWAAGMTPGDGTPVWRMDAFRDRLIEVFSRPH